MNTDPLNPFNITREELLALAAQKIADQFANEDDLSKDVEKRISGRIEQAFANGLSKRIDSFLLEEMTKLVEKELVPVDIWGDACGKPTTIRAALHAHAQRFWQEKVDGEGRSTTSYGGKSRHEWLFMKCVGKEFEEAVRQNIVDVLGGLKEAIRDDAKASVDRALSELLRVKSLKEQNK